MCCRHGGRVTCGMWNTRTWFSFLVRHVSVCCDRVSSDTCCTRRNKPCTNCCQWLPGNVQGGVVPHPAYEEGLTAAVDCCVAVTDELQAEFIFEYVEGAKVVAGTAVRSIFIHDDVGVVRGPNEELHEEPVQPAVVASCLVQACNLVVLVHGSHVPAKRDKVIVHGGRTFMQNCVKKAGSSLTWCSQPQAVVQSTVRACPPHA